MGANQGIAGNRAPDRSRQSRRGVSLATAAEKYIPGDPMLAKFWPQISWLATFHTTPPGASVFRRNYGSKDAWELVGRSPIDKRRVPGTPAQWRFELKGFVPVERATVKSYGTPIPSDTISITLDRETEAPAGMVHQTNSRDGTLNEKPATLRGLAGYEDLTAVPIRDYWIDRYEVTNREFKTFIEKGGYRDQRYWTHEFRKDGRKLSWAEAIEMFRDTTGRPGPATWQSGTFPSGQEDYPVAGVSWYEAAAYAEFSGKRLPTIYHWVTAASPWASSRILPLSNFGSKGPARVGASGAMSFFGAYDMAGNVKEWCWNEAGSGKRLILGGGWDEPYYMFNDIDARSTFERRANFGFRCARYDLDGRAASAADPIVQSGRDFNHERPVSDGEFRIYRSLYSYDKIPLNATVERMEQNEVWTREKITFSAAYGSERMFAYLYLPREARPPLQTVVLFPGSEAIDLRNSATMPTVALFDFVIKSGRALFAPVYKGTYERADDLKSDYPSMSSSWRDHVIAWSKDLGRSIDYLETRPDIDSERLAYLGFSWGAAMGPVLVAVEPRIRACVLVVPGLDLRRSRPEVDGLNFAPRVTVPVLMLNGRFDPFSPPQTSQEPMFRLLGTPSQHKRRVVFETGHNIPTNELIRETLDWLDEVSWTCHVAAYSIPNTVRFSAVANLL